METGGADFIIIDDNKVDCFIAEKIIENSGKSSSCRIFYEATLALEYLRDQPVRSKTLILFVDIQMPVMNGFEFVTGFEQLVLPNENFYHVYALSSSINERDIEKIKTFRSVKGFLNKPITVNIINDIVNAPSR